MSRARRRREAFDLVAFAFGGIANCCERHRLARAGATFKRRDLVSARKNLVDCGALALIEVVEVPGSGFSSTLSQLRVVALAGTHAVNRFLLELHHCWRRE